MDSALDFHTVDGVGFPVGTLDLFRFKYRGLVYSGTSTVPGSLNRKSNNTVSCKYSLLANIQFFKGCKNLLLQCYHLVWKEGIKPQEHLLTENMLFVGKEYAIC